MLSKERISNVVEKWYIIEPLFFIVWTTHELRINPNLQTIRVGQGLIEYNPAFIETLDDKTLYQVLQFEVMRIILKHPYLRRKDRATVAYQASNITLQEYLRTALPFPYAKEIFQTSEYDQKYFEFYYHHLLTLLEEVPASFSDGATGSGEVVTSDSGSVNEPATANAGGGQQNTSPSNSAPFAEEEEGRAAGSGMVANLPKLHKYADPEQSGAENTETWDANEYYTNQVNDQIESVQQSNSWGTLSARIQERILATLKPKVNYRDILKSFRATILSVKRVLTRMKPSRRYEFLYMGSRRDFCTKLLFAVDVSGSVSSEDLRKAFSIVNRFFKYGMEQIDVLQFDAALQGEPLTLKKAKKKMAIVGRGGTNFQVVMDYIDQEKDYDGLIIFTDGYAPVPEPPKNKRTRILWLFNNEQNCVRMKDHLKPIGRATFIKES